MLLKLTEIGRLAGLNEIHPLNYKYDSNIWLALGCATVKKKTPSQLFIESTTVQRAIRDKLPVYTWIRKYADESDYKSRVPWHRRVFNRKWMYEGEYKIVESVECTKVITACGTYLVSETPEQIMEMQTRLTY